MWRWCLYVLFVFNIKLCVPQIKRKEVNEVSYQIAGIFEANAITQKLAFNESTQSANINQRRWKPTILIPARTDSYSVWRELCNDTSMRPLAIVGPQNAISDVAIRDQCFIANIPHIQAAWQPFDPDLELNEPEPDEETADEENEENEEDEENEGNEEEDEAEDNEEEEGELEEPEDKAETENPTFKKISINFFPDADEISIAYARLLKYYRWEGFAALYEDDFGLLRIQKILAEHTYKWPVAVRRLDPDGDNHKIFKELTRFTEGRILIDCHVDRIQKYMKIAENLHMLNNYQHYIFLSLDTSVLAESMTRYESNITWLSLTEYDTLQYSKHFLAPRVPGWKLKGGFPPVTDFQLEALLLDDVATHVLESVRNLEEELELDQLPEPRRYVCSDEKWEYGARLQKKILEKETMGVTGKIQFDKKGRRTNYTLYVNEIHLKERETIGHWMSEQPDEIIDDRKSAEAKGSQSTTKEFIVISRKAEPFFFDNPECKVRECLPQEKYKGFSVDLVDQIFTELKKEFNYSYVFVYDKDIETIEYGKYNPKEKKWNGLIGKLLDKKADLAVCDLTITEERKQVVDFSVPFMSLGISILFTKDHKVVPGMFSFLNPYAFDVWMHTATAYCVVSIVLYVCARISPADWENPQPCDKDPEELENIWNFKNCVWLTMGSIMTQGCDILPKGFGTRWVCGMWWFFAVIVCQTYIAQLSASMTSAMEDAPINSVEDLAKQNKILYGAIDGGSTYGFFKSSKDKTYRTIFETMNNNPVLLVKNNDEGVRRVINGKNKYAFFMESATIEYKLKRNCELKKVGGELDSKDYGIAMPANSPFRSQINRAILRLKELTKLDEIKALWWEKKNNDIKCPPPKDENDTEGDLEMENLIGAFLVLIVGLVFCLFITAAEFMDEVRNIVVREQVSHKEAFIKELKASLNFFQLQKPVLRNPSRAPSIAGFDNDEAEEKQKKRMAVIENFLDFEKEVQ